jgi:hypothetical protein
MKSKRRFPLEETPQSAGRNSWHRGGTDPYNTPNTKDFFCRDQIESLRVNILWPVGFRAEDRAEQERSPRDGDPAAPPAPHAHRRRIGQAPTIPPYRVRWRVSEASHTAAIVISAMPAT